MSQMTLVEVFEVVKALPPDDLQQLREWLARTEASSQPMMTEEEFHQHLLQAGIISKVPGPIKDFKPYLNRTPVQIEGGSLSQTIIEDRGK